MGDWPQIRGEFFCWLGWLVLIYSATVVWYSTRGKAGRRGSVPLLAPHNGLQLLTRSKEPTPTRNEKLDVEFPVISAKTSYHATFLTFLDKPSEPRLLSFWR